MNNIIIQSEVIDGIAERVVNKLTEKKLIRVSNDAFRKTEKVLYIYWNMKENHSKDKLTEDFIKRIETSLDQISDDPYFELIDLKYHKLLTHETIAEQLHCDPSTVSRKKNRFIKQLSFMLFSKEAIEELLQE